MKNIVFPFAVFLVLVLGFQNCGYFSTSGVFVASSCGGNDADLLPAFQATYHQFFLNNSCNSCHTPGGQKGDSAFAGPDAFAALGVFRRLGPDAIQNKLAGGHQGYSYNNLKPDLDAAREGYQAAGGGGFCADGVNTTGGVRKLFFENTAMQDLEGNNYFPLMVDKLDTFEIATYDLGEPPFEPQFPGVIVTMEISVRYADSVEVPRRPTGYVVQNIRMKSETSRMHIKGINVLLNGDNHQVTTFQNADYVVLPGGAETTISGTGSANFFLDTFSNNDLWQIQFNEIQEQ